LLPPPRCRPIKKSLGALSSLPPYPPRDWCGRVLSGHSCGAARYQRWQPCSVPGPNSPEPPPTFSLYNGNHPTGLDCDSLGATVSRRYFRKKTKEIFLYLPSYSNIT
jgi:hypothetical protein